MQIYANGRMHEVPSDNDGKVDVVEVRRAANIPDGRTLIQQKPNGENAMLPRNGHIQANPYDRFIEASRGKRGLSS